MSTIAPTVSCGSPNGAGFVAVRKPFPRGRHIGDPIHAEPEGGGKQVAVEADVKNLAKDASDLYVRILDGLDEYYRSDMMFGLLAERLHIPDRALIEFMRRYGLPYKGGEGDRERGLGALAKIRRR